MANALADGIEALRAQGAPRLDPLRFAHIEALARRAAAHAGPARAMMDARLAALVAACTEALAAQAAAHAIPPRPPRGLLGDLVHGRSRPQPATPHAAAPPAVAALPFFRRTWLRLNAEHRLAQSQAERPGNAGPLNSQHLVHRALAAMREASPGYLDRFVAQVDTLLALEAALGTGPLAAAAPKAARAKTRR